MKRGSLLRSLVGSLVVLALALPVLAADDKAAPLPAAPAKAAAAPAAPAAKAPAAPAAKAPAAAAAAAAAAAQDQKAATCDDKWFADLATKLKALDGKGLSCNFTPAAQFKVASLAKNAAGKVGPGGVPAKVSVAPKDDAFTTADGLGNLVAANPLIFEVPGAGAEWAAVDLSFEKVGNDVVFKVAKKAAPGAIANDRGGDQQASSPAGEVKLSENLLPTETRRFPTKAKQVFDVSKLTAASGQSVTEVSEGIFTIENGAKTFKVQVKLVGEEFVVTPYLECGASVFEPGKMDEEAIEKACKHSICITPSGKRYGLKELTDRTGTITVELWAPRSNDVTYELEATYEKTVLNNGGLKPIASEKQSGNELYFSRIKAQAVPLTSAGKLTIKVSTQAGPNATVTAEAKGACLLTQEPEPQPIVVPVSGRYYFMLGFMPAYGGIYDRKNTLHRSDDGVQRVFQQDTQEVDYAATLTAFPHGINEDLATGPAFGALIGTSVRNPGKRWYLGLAVSTPINIAFVAGAQLAVVDTLDQDFVAGQPLEDTNFPTHSTVVPTWFVGVNVEAELFKKAFKGIVGDGK